MPKNCCWIIQSHTSLKPSGRSGYTPSAFAHEQQAGQVQPVVYKVRDIPGHQRGYLEGRTISQLLHSLPHVEGNHCNDLISTACPIWWEMIVVIYMPKC